MKNDISKIAEKIESNMFYGDEEEYEPYMNYGGLSDLKEKVGIEDFSYGFLVFAEKMNQEHLMPLGDTMDEILTQEESPLGYGNSSCQNEESYDSIKYNETISANYTNMMYVYEDMGVHNYLQEAEQFVDKTKLDVSEQENSVSYMKNEGKNVYDKLNKVADINNLIKETNSLMNEYIKNSYANILDFAEKIENTDSRILGIAFEKAVREHSSNMFEDIHQNVRDRKLIDIGIACDFANPEKFNSFSNIFEDQIYCNNVSNTDVLNNVLLNIDMKNAINQYVDKDGNMEELKSLYDCNKNREYSMDYYDGKNDFISIGMEDIALSNAFINKMHENTLNTEKLTDIYNTFDLGNNKCFNILMADYVQRTNRENPFISEEAKDMIVSNLKETIDKVENNFEKSQHLECDEQNFNENER